MTGESVNDQSFGGQVMQVLDPVTALVMICHDRSISGDESFLMQQKLGTQLKLESVGTR